MKSVNWKIIIFGSLFLVLLFGDASVLLAHDRPFPHCHTCRRKSGFDEDGHLHGIYAIENALEIGNGGVAVRSGPGKEYTVVSVITEGAFVTAIGRNDYPEDFHCQRQVDRSGNTLEEIAEQNLQAWLQIELVEGYFTGWVNLCMVQFDEGDDIPLVKVEPECPVLQDDDVSFFKESEEIQDGAYLAIVSSETARLRSTFNGCALEYGRIRKGEVVEILEFHTVEGKEWVRVNYQGLSGWLIFEDVNYDNSHLGLFQ